MLDIDQINEFDESKSEFQNPSCDLLYKILCELTSLELFATDSLDFSRTICSNIFELFFMNRFSNQAYLIEKKEFVYWINAAGLIIANLPEVPLLINLYKTFKINLLLLHYFSE
jgi:hypothetical protein